jgi:hypothetical protein
MRGDASAAEATATATVDRLALDLAHDAGVVARGLQVGQLLLLELGELTRFEILHRQPSDPFINDRGHDEKIPQRRKVHWASFVAIFWFSRFLAFDHPRDHRLNATFPVEERAGRER